MSRRTNCRAFSLIELLAVIAILAILLGLSMAGFRSISESYSITSSAQETRNFLNLARQEAVSRNRPVEIRFCREDAASPIRTVQAVLHEANGSWREVARAIRLSEHVRIDSASTGGSLFSSNNAAEVPGATGFVPNPLSDLLLLGSANYQVFSFCVLPDGTTTLPWNPVTPWIMIRPATENDAVNYAVIQIDPVNGRAGILHP